ncbi:succinate dehydrogenase [ubiquinone] cytochrome b small subunit, mitochondrial [Dermacentor silvarum]|uniref:succinate dehydrogenase [ubiquinone] cytochrome b small subunit, mitochondrial n=1 Tax=Dermacentor silvarum TaxID=543639 RepID=UPI00189BA589|nr:succinate dehydrogenase [ubiquinone] cytochrome b small subunit, mitochondrial [Dermacentor silvarum]
MAASMLRLTMCRGTSLGTFQARAFFSTVARKQLPVVSSMSHKIAPYNPQVTAVRLASADANYVNIWKAERILAASMLAIVPGAFMLPCPVMDCLLAISAVVHMHWGVETIVVDYVRPALFGNLIPKVAVGAVYALSIAALTGLFYFNFTDVGIIKAIQMLWTV